MKHIWSMLCKSSSIDKETNLITLRDCIEQLDITVPKKAAKKVVPIEFELVHLWSVGEIGEAEKFEVKTELYDPENQRINGFSGFFTFPKNKKRLRTCIQVKGLPFTSVGEYKFKIKLKEENQKQYKEVAEIPLDITFGYK